MPDPASAPSPPAAERQVSTLGPPRHACHACGVCCSGWRVRLADESERERVRVQAALLGVADPIIDGELRQVDATCVFLGPDRLCRIHARFGEAEKPLSCQLFPRRSLRAEDGVRFGVDPGCTTTWRTFADGPEVSLWYIPTEHDEHRQPGPARVERHLISLARRPDMTLPRFAALLSDEDLPAPERFPLGLGTRLLDRLRGTIELLAHRDNGPRLVAGLTPLIDLLRLLPPEPNRLAPERLPPLVFPAALDAFTLDLLQRTLFLRLGGHVLPPSAQALVVLAGALGAALATPDPARYGPALSAFSRVSRLDGFWARFAPDTATARWVATGERDD